MLGHSSRYAYVRIVGVRLRSRRVPVGAIVASMKIVDRILSRRNIAEGSPGACKEMNATFAIMAAPSARCTSMRAPTSSEGRAKAVGFEADANCREKATKTNVLGGAERKASRYGL